MRGSYSPLSVVQEAAHGWLIGCFLESVNQVYVILKCRMSKEQGKEAFFSGVNSFQDKKASLVRVSF